MVSFVASLLFQAAQAPAAPPPDPHRLAIGRPGEIKIVAGEMRNTETGQISTMDDIVQAAKGHRFVFIGESHDQATHHQFQADVISALAKSGRDVMVGFEMFTRPVQANLNAWPLGWQTEDQFIVESDWKKQWGFDFALYRPIFEATKAHRLPMVALNVPRDWVRKISRGGPDALAPEEQAQVPKIDPTNENHKKVFEALMGGHPMTGVQGHNIYCAQVLWDTAMADSALKYWDRMPRTRNSVMVIVAGIGHTMYGQGINYQIKKRTGESGLNLAAINAKEPATISRGLADFVAAFE